MKTKLFAFIALLLSSSAVQTFACATCFGNYPAASGGPPPTLQHMGVAIWFLMAAVMSVLGGVGAFSFHLWRYSRLPLEPHQELVQEDFSQYD